MLPIICIALVLRPGHATGGARVLIWTCWGLNFSTAWCTVTDTCRKRLEACIHAKGCHSEHLLWRCLLGIPVATCHTSQPVFSDPLMPTHNWLFLEPPTFAFYKVVWWHFQVRWASWLQFVFFWDKINNQKYVGPTAYLFGFPKVKWLHLTGEVDKCVRLSCHVFSGKIIEIG